MPDTVPSLKTNDGLPIPQLGVGVLWMSPEAAAEAVSSALAIGYRLIDTASVYLNEEGVGAGIRQSGLDRASIYLTTKLFNHEHGYDEALLACERSLARLGTDYLDLYLIHWPVPTLDLYVGTWKALVRLREEGRVRSIGVSNFQPEHLDRLLNETDVAPAINQIEVHPSYQQRDLRGVHARLGIVTQAWSPLGQGRDLSDPVIARIARKHDRSPAQIIQRWHLQSGTVTIASSTKHAHLADNFAVFDFILDDIDMASIRELDRHDGSIGPDPRTFVGRSASAKMIEIYADPSERSARGNVPNA